MFFLVPPAVHLFGPPSTGPQLANVSQQALRFGTPTGSAILVMEYSLSRLAQTNRVDTSQPTNKMSLLTMPLPNPHTGFHREFAWQDARSYEPAHRPRNEPEKIALPSIRQVA